MCGTYCPVCPIPPLSATTPGSAHLVHIDGGAQVLEHGGHELHVHAMGPETVEHQEGRVGKLLRVHAVSAQGGDDITH